MTPKLRDDSPWDLHSLLTAPAVYEASGFVAKGVQAVFFDTLPHQGKPTRAFAWIGLPEGTEGIDANLPGMVLVHGGGGTAFEDWVQMWTARGYAAIALDTCGATPGGEPPPRPRHEFSGPPGWGGFDQIDHDARDQWTYHAVADVLLAHSLLRSLPEVDETRIGLTGISWGGYLTCIVSGLDDRFRFAAPIYGCGFLGENSGWLQTFKDMGEEPAGRWLDRWDPSHYLPHSDLPMLWVTGTNDQPYPMDSRQKSYRLPSGHRTLSIKPEMTHGHPEGQDVPEVFAFADFHLCGGPELTYILGQARDGQHAWVTFQADGGVSKVLLQYSNDTGPWADRVWNETEAQVDHAAGRATATVPEGAAVYYFNVIDERGLVISSEHEELSR